jgi:hypothetical protein
MEERKRQEAELDKQYYGAMVKAYFDTCLLIEKNIATWGSLAIGGLLAFGASKSGAGGFILSLWITAIALFVAALICTLFGLLTSAKYNSEEISVFPEFPANYWQRRHFIKLQNWIIAILFVLGVVVSSVLIVRFVIISLAAGVVAV